MNQDQNLGANHPRKTEVMLAQYRRDKKRKLRVSKAGAMERLGVSPFDPVIETLWDSQLNHHAAETMLELLLDLQGDLPEQADRITAVLRDLGIEEG